MNDRQARPRVTERSKALRGADETPLPAPDARTPSSGRVGPQEGLCLCLSVASDDPPPRPPRPGPIMKGKSVSRKAEPVTVTDDLNGRSRSRTDVEAEPCQE